MQKYHFILFFTFFFIGELTSQNNLLKLDDCLRIAEENSYLLQNEMLNIEIAHNNSRQAGFSFLPSVNADAHHQLSSSLFSGIGNQPYSGQTSINANLQLFNWFYNWARLEQTRNNIKAHNFSLKNQELELDKNVIEAFFSLLIANENLSAYEEIVAATDSLVKSTMMLHEAGKIPNYNIDEAKLQLSQDRQMLLSSKERFRVAQINLMRIMNVSEPVYVDYDYYNSQIIHQIDSHVPAFEEFRMTVLSGHPVLQQLSMEYENIHLEKRMIASSMKPSLSLRYSMQSHYSQFEVNNFGFFDSYGDNFAQFLTLNLSIPIFYRMERRTQLLNNELSARKLLNTTNEQQTHIGFMVEELYFSLNHQQAVFEQSVMELQHLRKVYEAHSQLYMNGKGNLFTVLNYRKQLNQIISSNVRDKYALAIIQEILSLYSFY